MFVCPECGAAQPGPGHCGTDGAQVLPIGEDLLLGQTIHGFRVARLLGIGGMGRVYKGVHPSIGSRVAIKVLSRECSDRKDLVERFFSEAKAVNLIRHESIVNVIDLAMLPDGRPYIIMEYLDGAPLSALVEASVQARTPIPLGGLARLAGEVLDALGAAHAKGIVHRDLKPDNIFVTPAGRPKVLDFGIAKLSDSTPGAGTATGSLLGTPHYMAPEQAAGRPVDHRADLYAMGVILFECATGAKPFTADSLFDLLRKHVEAPPPSPRQLRPDMPPALEQVILVALAKAPEQRFANAQAMSVALQHATTQLAQDQWAPITIQGRPTGLPTPSWSSQPPASWAAPRGPRESVQPANVQQPTTVSAGQVTGRATPPKPSRKGLYIALFSLVLVGGGITAVVLASGGDEGGSSGSTTATASTATTAPSPPAVPAKPAGSGAAATPAAPATLVAAAPPAVPAKPAGATPAGVTPTAPAAPPPTPEKEDSDDDAPTSPGQAVAQIAEKPASGGAAGGANGWFKRHDVSPPTDPKKLDIDKHIDWAIAEAKRNVPDAQLIRIDIDGVFPDGHADLSLPAFAGNKGSIDLRFISPSHAVRDPKIPRGVNAERVCTFRILGGPDGFEIYDMFATDCKEAVIPRPKCSIAKVWKKALAKRKDLSDAVASLTYTSNIVSHKIVWMFDIRDGGETIFSEQFPDDC